MADRQPDHPWLTANCPKCGLTHGGKNLQALTKAITACRKRQAPKVRPFPSLGLTIRLEGKVVSYNQTYHTHWRQTYGVKKEWDGKMTQAVAALNIADALMQWSEWQITRVYSGREKEMDDANFVGSVSMKAAIDTLVRLAVIKDDRPSNFKATYVQRRGETSHVEFKLIDVRNSPPGT